MLLVGALAGYVASKIMKTDAQMGIPANIIVGILGSILAGTLYNLLFRGELGLTTAFLNFSIGGVITSILGAVLLIGILKALNKQNLL